MPSPASSPTKAPIPVNRLHDALRDEGRSFGWLAKTSGFSIYHISKVANGHDRPSRHFRRRIADALGLPETRIWPKNGRKGRAA